MGKSTMAMVNRMYGKASRMSVSRMMTVSGQVRRPQDWRSRGKLQVWPKGYVFAPKTNCGILSYEDSISREAVGRST